MSYEVLDAEQIQRELDTRRVGRRVQVLSESASTNEVVLTSVDRDDADGLAVLADYQTAGRGRLGRTWESPRAASVLCSVLLIEPASGGLDPGMLTLAAGVAAGDAVTAVAPDIVLTIRWPNDVFVGVRKLAGVLIESRTVPIGRAYAVGVGINCLQHRRHFDRTLRKRATSLEAESRYPVSRLAVARQLLIELDRWLALRPDGQALREAWLERAEPLGQHLHLRQAGHDYVGRTVDVDPTAGLTVELDSGGRRVFDPATTSRLPSP